MDLEESCFCVAELTLTLSFLQFADWCMNYGKHGCRTPDTPFSLFEGNKEKTSAEFELLIWSLFIEFLQFSI